MKILLLQLSYIHLHAGGENPFCRRAAEIVDAVRNSDYELDAAILVLSGDIAFAGHSDEST
jgi:hypothetical protein